MPLGAGGDQYNIAVETILNATKHLFGSMGNAQEMVRQAKILAEATASLVNAIKLEAKSKSDPGESSDLPSHTYCFFPKIFCQLAITVVRNSAKG